MNQPLNTLNLDSAITNWNALVERIQGFIKEVNGIFAEANSKRNAEMLAKFPGITVEDYHGPLEIRGGSIRGDWLALDHKQGGQRSIYCFIRLTDGENKTLGVLTAGDIHKPASYKAPAKHKRGTVFADDFGKSCTGLYGIQYLR
jgi:hypothetical protein